MALRTEIPMLNPRSGIPALVLMLLLLLGAFAVGGHSVAAATAGSFSCERFQNWNLIAPSSVAAGTSMHCAVEIPGPPPPNSTIPPFKVQVTLNGWLVPDPIAHFNYETNTWDFDYVVPPGSNGGVIKIFIHPGAPEIPSISTDRKIS